MYARCDSHYLIPLWRLLRARLLAADTFSNREDAREEEELREIKRGLDADQRRKEEAARQQRQPPLAALALAPAAGGSSPEKPTATSGAVVSPARLAQEPRVSEWDDPEDCHRRERSRSGSFFRSDLESIHETAAAAASATAGGQSLEKALAAAFQEDDDGDDGDGDQAAGATDGADYSASAAVGGSGLHHHTVDLGANLMDEGETEEERNDDDERDTEEPGDEEDEDEDLWEGWGEEDALGGNNGDGSGAVVVDQHTTQNLHGEEEEEEGESAAAAVFPGPLSSRSATPAVNDSSGREEEDQAMGGTGAFDDNQGSAGEDETKPAPVVPLPSSPSTTPVAAPPGTVLQNGAASKDDHARGRGRGSRPNANRNGGAMQRTTAREQPEAVVLTDGVRLVWKALSRTQTATAVLWRPGPQAKRKDSHNERHFRTAVQRLKPPRWTEVNVRVYEEIFLWRDRTARRMDDGAAYVCPGDILIDVALAMPTTLDALRRVSAPLSPVLGHADTAEAAELVRVVRVALRLPAEEEQGEGGTAAGRIRGGIGSRVLALDGGSRCDGGSRGGSQGGAVVFSTKSLALAAAAISLGVAVALSKRRWFS